MYLAVTIILGVSFLIGFINFMRTGGKQPISIYSTAALVLLTWEILPIALVVMLIWIIQAIIFLTTKR